MLDFLLVQEYINHHRSLLKIFNTIIWMSAVGSWITVIYQKAIANKARQTVENIPKKLIAFQDFKDSLSEAFPLLFALSIVCLPVFAIFLIVFTNDDYKNTTYVVSDSFFQKIGMIATILLK